MRLSAVLVLGASASLGYVPGDERADKPGDEEVGAVASSVDPPMTEEEGMNVMREVLPLWDVYYGHDPYDTADGQPYVDPVKADLYSPLFLHRVGEGRQIRLWRSNLLDRTPEEDVAILIEENRLTILDVAVIAAKLHEDIPIYPHLAALYGWNDPRDGLSGGGEVEGDIYEVPLAPPGDPYSGPDTHTYGPGSSWNGGPHHQPPAYTAPAPSHVVPIPTHKPTRPTGGRWIQPNTSSRADVIAIFNQTVVRYWAPAFFRAPIFMMSVPDCKMVCKLGFWIPIATSLVCVASNATAAVPGWVGLSSKGIAALCDTVGVLEAFQHPFSVGLSAAMVHWNDQLCGKWCSPGHAPSGAGGAPTNGAGGARP